ncbi:MAG: hypothetical protein AAGC73_09495 [Verrucomicrobiota bacterium]
MSKRDRLLLMVLPAFMILLIYGLLVARPKLASLKELRRQAEVLETRIPEPAEQTAMRRELAALQAEMADFRRASSRAGGAVGAVSPEVSLETEAFFEALLAKHKLIVINETAASRKDIRSFEKVVSRSAGNALWEIEVAANFTSVMAFLSELGNTELPLTPVAVDMVANYQVQTDLRLWNLWIYR